MSDIIQEIQARQAVIAAEKKAEISRRELRNKLLQQYLEPFIADLSSLREAGWQPMKGAELTIDSINWHGERSWSRIHTYGSPKFDIYLKVDENIVLHANTDKEKGLSKEAVRSLICQHVAQWYKPPAEDGK